MIDDGTVVLLCKAGRLFDLQRWIHEGRPLQLDQERPPHHSTHRSALEVCIETGQHSMAQLLLEAGYRLDEGRRSPFDCAFRKRRTDIIDLLFEHGADPKRASPWELFATYDRLLVQRFYDAGLDLAQGHDLSLYLSEHTNKPLLGFCRRQAPHDRVIRRELLMAFHECVPEPRLEKRAMPCLWAGADPHERLPEEDVPGEEWAAAVELAVLYRNLPILRACKPDPERIDFDKLYRYARQEEAVAFLSEIKGPRDMTPIMESMCGQFGDIRTMRAVLALGPRWETASKETLAQIRQQLLWMARDRSRYELGDPVCRRGDTYRLKEMLQLLMDPEFCAPEIFAELTRTQTMQKHLQEMGLVKPREKPRPKTQEEDELFSRFARRFDRQQLYVEVWAEPAAAVGERHGCSGSYVKRACRALRIPTPPLGYWRRLATGGRPRQALLRRLPKRLQEIADFYDGERRRIAAEVDRLDREERARSGGRESDPESGERER